MTTVNLKTYSLFNQYAKCVNWLDSMI